MDQLGDVLTRARVAQGTWAAQTFGERLAALRRSAKRMLADRATVLRLLRSEIGKLEVEGLFSEALGPLDQLNAWAKIVRRTVRRRVVHLNPLGFPSKRAYYDRIPRGVVGVIGPWNYPYATYFRSVWPALLTGNAVVLKPSEHAPETARWMASQLQPELPEGLFNVVPGDGSIGQEMLRSGIDACVFTGSTKTGKLVQRSCVDAGIPFSAEMGGNDPAIVLPDCNLERTTAGITYWALHNAGQSCAAVEVAYVHEDVADRFVEKLGRAWQELRTEGEADVAPLAQRRQFETVCRHVADARARGAEVICGGHPIGDGPGFEPTVLDHCHEEMDVVREETFGPVLPVCRVSSADEAVERANRSRYGLTASLWSANVEHAERLASRLDYGVVTINNHAVGGAIPMLPLSGTRDSGYSVANSELALGTFVRPRAVLIDRHQKPEVYWIPFDLDLTTLGEILCDAQTGTFSRVWRIPALIRRRVRHLRRYFA